MHKQPPQLPQHVKEMLCIFKSLLNTKFQMNSKSYQISGLAIFIYIHTKNASRQPGNLLQLATISVETGQLCMRSTKSTQHFLKSSPIHTLSMFNSIQTNSKQQVVILQRVMCIFEDNQQHCIFCTHMKICQFIIYKGANKNPFNYFSYLYSVSTYKGGRNSSFSCISLCL